MDGGEGRRAERFREGWIQLEQHLVRRWRDQHPGQQEPDIARILVWAERSRLLSRRAADFLHSCRQARNAYNHVRFHGYDGPVAVPPQEVVERLEHLHGALARPPALDGLIPVASCCTPDDRLSDVLRLMREGDWSQLPYRHPVHDWVLVTREQVARWLEVHADAEDTALCDLGVPVAALADHEDVGVVRPRVLGRGATVPDAVEALEATLRTPDTQDGGYPAVLVRTGPIDAVPRILTSDDLPVLTAALGR